MRILILFIFLPLNLLAINPDREYILTPDSIGWEYEQLIISTEDGYDLNTWIYQAKPDNRKDKVVVLAYPDAGNMSYFVYHASILASLGYTVVTFDYRGFGKSSDFEVERNNLFQIEFSNDLKAVVNYTAKRFDESDIGIWAWSMGAMVTTYAYENIKDKLDFLVFDAFVFNPGEHIQRIKIQKEKQTHSPIESSQYISKWKAINTPILIFAGKDDELTTIEDVKSKASEFAVEPVIRVYDGGHLMGFQHQISTNGFGGWYAVQMNEFIQNN